MNIYDFYGKPLTVQSEGGHGGSIFDATEVTTSSQFWFTGANASAMGTSGQVMACAAGDKFWWNGKFAGNGPYTTPRMLSALPNAGSIYDTSVTIGETLNVNEDGSYSATADGAVYFPITFNSGSAIETYLANNFTYHGSGMWFIMKGGKIDGYYAKNFPVNHVFNAHPSPFDLAGLLKNYIPMIGAKVAVLGDSLSEQSAGYAPGKDAYGFYQGTCDSDGWFSRIARKYNMDYRVHGVGMQRWYNTESLPSGAVKAVKSLLESGYEPDYIVLEYGTNDIWSGAGRFGTAEDAASDTAESTVSAIRWCIETLQERLPSSKIIVIMPCMRNGAAAQQTYYDLADPILNEYGVRRVDMKNESGIAASMMNPDGVHLALARDGGGYDNATEAVARFSRALEAEMLKL